MKNKDIGGGKLSITQHIYHQESLFSERDRPETQPPASPQACQVVAVGKRRDGGMRYWCLRHKANATAKYGKPASSCRAAHVPPVSSEDLDIDEYTGGVALWGAVPAVYDTTRLPMDRGIHVHGRMKADARKEIDRTFRAVRVFSNFLPTDGILVSELDAIYFMVTSVFGYKTKHIMCSNCSHPHLDRDWFSVHPHRRHLCAGCGKHFRDSETGIGNPISGLRDASRLEPQRPITSKKKLHIKQADFPGGIQIWGSNPAFFWNSSRTEEEGIHIHAFRPGSNEPDPDETFGEVTIDGISLEPSMVRNLMAQKTLPSLKNRVLSIDCPSCHEPHSSEGELAFTPVSTHNCIRCAHQFVAPGRLRKSIANPLLAILARLAKKAPRKPQLYDLDLMPETL